jgi:hypothetical protein
MLERDRRPQLISLADVLGADGLPPAMPPSEYIFAAVWAAGAEVAVVYGASSGWSEELFVADFDASLYHGGFFADLATRVTELAKACRAPPPRVTPVGTHSAGPSDSKIAGHQLDHDGSFTDSNSLAIRRVLFLASLPAVRHLR